MITYIGLLNFTEKGVQSIKETTKRAAAAKEAGKKFGVNMREIYWTMGEYDLVCVLEADSEQSLDGVQPGHRDAGQCAVAFAASLLGQRDGRRAGQASLTPQRRWRGARGRCVKGPHRWRLT